MMKKFLDALRSWWSWRSDPAMDHSIAAAFIAGATASKKRREHVHEWRSPDLETTRLTSKEMIEFSLLGQSCECGAIRMYGGPAVGWVERLPR